MVTLMGSKASQDQAETIVVPCADMPAACQALDAWAGVAGLRPAQAEVSASGAAARYHSLGSKCTHMP